MTAATDLDLAAFERFAAENGLRILWPHRPLETYSYESGGVLRGLYVDVETTSLDTSTAEVIECACAAFKFTKDGVITSVTARYSSFEQPRTPIPTEITAVTGITDDDVRGTKIDDAEVAELARGSDLVVAHNARYDRPILERRFPGVFDSLVFGDSWSDVDWRGHGFACGKLAHLLMDACREHYTAHRALDDVLAGIHLLAVAKLGDRPAFAHLLESAKRPTVRFRLVDTPRGSNGLLKQRGYRAEYDGPQFVCWWKDVARDDEGTEHAWAAANGMGRPSVKLVRRRDAFTDRAGRHELDAGPYFEIPIGTPLAACKSCDQPVYFIITRRGKRMPVSIAAEGCRAPDTFPEGQLNVFGGVDQPAPGRGISHFSDCPDAEQWRTRGKGQRAGAT